jgi:ribosomal protein S18 acetylase RimI-like enzyme
VEIRAAIGPDDLMRVRELFQEYAASLGFDRELASLPGEYAPPRGTILLATGSEFAGCVALRPLSTEICEMKRLYVRPAHRGTGLGKRLAEAILAEGRAHGYHHIRLDTVPGMESAIGLYSALGFREIAPYRANPITGALFMEREL